MNPESWQPIETAPKDGMRILLYYGGDTMEVKVGHYRNIEYYEHGKLQYKNEGWSLSVGVLGIAKEFQPTHWAPLPKPPEIKQ